MYKRKFTRWSLRKNRSGIRRHDEDPTTAVGDCFAASQSGRPLLPKHQSGSQGCGTRRKADATFERSNDHFNLSLPLATQDIQSTPLFPQLFEYSKESHDVEFALRQSHIFYLWYLQQTDVTPNFGFAGSLRTVISSLEAGMYLLPKDLKRAFSFFEQACANVKPLLFERPFLLLQHIVAGFQPKKWAQQGARIHILNFVVAMSMQVLGRTHPLTVISRMLLNNSTLQDLPIRFLDLLSTIVTRAFEEDHPRLLRLQLRIAEEHAYYDHLDVAQTLCQAVAQHTIQTLGPDHLVTRRAYRRLGIYSWQLGALEDAKVTLLQCLEATVRLDGSPNATRTGINTCRYLGCVYRDSYEYSLSKHYFTLALEGWQSTNRAAEDMVKTLHELEDILVAMHDSEALKKLRTDYADILHYGRGTQRS
jgi:tetratricopeptide (TPR) repeat protein